MASAPATGTISSTRPSLTAHSVRREMKSGAQPCIGCGLNCGWLVGTPAASRACGMPLASTGAISGSAATMRTHGSAFFSARATPSSVPPVPKPVTKAWMRWPAKSSRISRAVVRVWISALASLSNWRHRNQPCLSASPMALFSMPVPFSAAGVSTTRAPRKRSSLRRSTLKLSAIVSTSG
jgi:hypothetical protein